VLTLPWSVNGSPFCASPPAESAAKTIGILQGGQGPPQSIHVSPLFSRPSWHGGLGRVVEVVDAEVVVDVEVDVVVVVLDVVGGIVVVDEALPNRSAAVGCFTVSTVVVVVGRFLTEVVVGLLGAEVDVVLEAMHGGMRHPVPVASMQQPHSEHIPGLVQEQSLQQGSGA